MPAWRDLRDKESAVQAAQFNKHRSEMDAHYKQNAHDILKKHGYTLAHGAGTHSIYDNNDIKKKTHYTATVFHDQHSPHSIFVTNSGAVTRHSSYTHLDPEAHKEQKTHMPAKFESALIDHHKNTTFAHAPTTHYEDIAHIEFGLGKVLEESDTHLQVMFDHGIEDLELNK